MIKFSLDAKVVMIPYDTTRPYLARSNCYVDDYYYTVQEGDYNAIGDELREIISWAYAGGLIDFIADKGYVAGKYQIQCDMEIVYTQDYWGEGDVDIYYSNEVIKKIGGVLND